MTELNNDDPRAYIRLAVLVRDDIAAGNLQPGGPVPSITTLSQQHGHARQTCAKAMRLLVDSGLLFCVPGLGYYVTSDAREQLDGS